MIQLLFPNFMIKNSLIMLILSLSIFLFEYGVHLFKSSDYSENTIKYIKLIIPFDSDSSQTTIEYLLCVIAYCYYTQYQLYNYEFYQKLIEDKNLCLSVYIEIKLSEYPLIKKIIFFIGKIIKGLYIWSLISLFIFFDSYYEISVLFAIKLFIFFIIVFNFLRVIQSDIPNNINIILNWIFLIFCALNTISVYCFQFLCLDFFSINTFIKDTNNFYIKNFHAFGLYRYKESKLHLKFLPHFISNLISVLFIGEMKRLLKEDEKKENKIFEMDDINDTKNKLLIKKK